jgi:hypothetical protein
MPEEDVDVYEVMEEIMTEIEKLIPIMKLGRGIAMMHFRSRSKEEVKSFIESIASIGSKVIIAEREKALLESVYKCYSPESEVDKKTWEELSVKLKRMNMLE